MPRRWRLRNVASMRMRVPVSSSAASSASRAASRLPSTATGASSARSFSASACAAPGSVIEAGPQLGLDAIETLAIGRARQHLLPHQAEEGFERAERPAVLQALRPAIARQHPRRHHDLVERFRGDFVLSDEVLDTALETARARAPAAFIAQEPAPQLRAFLAGERRRESIVGGLEKMMALVEDVARRQIGIVETAERRLDHHQRMIGDDEPRAPRPAHALLDEAAMIVRTGGVDAFAAAIGERDSLRAAQQLGQPARQIAADHVAVTRRAHPARHKAEHDGVVSAHRYLRDAFFVIEQAKIILAAFAQDDAAIALRRIGIEPAELAGDLVLEIAREGRDPHRPLVLLGPDARRRDIAQGLADTGAGFGEDETRRFGQIARAESGADRGGVIRLLRPRLGISAEQLGEPRPRLAFLDREIARRRLGRVILPIGELAPLREPVAGPGSPSGKAASTAGPQPQPPFAIAVAMARASLSPAALSRASSAARRIDQRERFCLDAFRRRQAERRCQAARRRQAEFRRIDESEQLQQIERGERAGIEPPCRRARMTEKSRRRPGAPRRFGERKNLDLAIRREPGRLREAGDQRRRVGQDDGASDRKMRGFAERHGTTI